MKETGLLSIILKAYQLREQNQHVSALELCEKCLRAFPQNPEVHCLWGILLQDEKKYTLAEKSINRAIQINPRKSDYYFFLGNALFSQKKYKPAETAFRECIRKSDNHYLAYRKLARALEKQNKIKSAIKAYESAIGINPNYFKAYFGLATLYYRLSDFSDAIYTLQKALALKPNDLPTLSLLADLLMKDHQFDLAQRVIEKTLLIDNRHLLSLQNSAFLCVENFQPERASELMMQSLHIDPVQPELWRLLSLCKKYLSLNDPDIAQLKGQLSCSKSDDDKAQYYFALGKIYQDCEQFKKSFDYYKRANQLKSKSIDYNSASFKRRISSIIGQFNKRKMKKYLCDDENETQPIFIVGASCSGNSILEKILATHKKIQRGWDVGITNVVEKTSFENKPKGKYPYWLGHMTKVEALALKEAYLDRIHKDIEKTPAYIIDASIDNFEYVGLIRYLFPRAKIIHITRNPLDAGFNLYTRFYTEHHLYAYDLENIGCYFAEHQRMMAFWQQQLDEPFLTISYESLMTDTRNTLNQIFDYLQMKSHCSFPIHYLHQNEINSYKPYYPFLQPLLNYFS
ncbi:MAG: tetratricopeptide repeat protein [Candidatus Berkiella sp.]